VLPTIIFISAFFAVLYHIGLMQIIIRGMAWIMLKTMRISGAESMNVAASIFMGQTEAPLTIRPFLVQGHALELMVIMTSGMAHVSGGIMAMYISQGVEARHLLSAVIMTSPGTILIAKMLVPETGIPATEGKVVIPKDELHKDENLIGAIARGTIDGGKLAMNVASCSSAFWPWWRCSTACFSGPTAALHALGSRLAGPDSRLRLRARRVAHRRALARLPGHRQPARHPHGAE
jgi:CNT family concentrative nucleoside transporter